MSARIAPARPPFGAAIQTQLDRIMPRGVEPLALFTTLARDERLFQRFMGGGLLDKGHLTLRQREIVIGRVTAKCGCEYEWGIHVALFGKTAGFTADHLWSLRDGTANDGCWSEDEALLLRLCDSLGETCDLDDDLWRDLETVFSAEALMESILLAGFYRTVSYLANGLRLPLEQGSARFPGGAGEDSRDGKG